MYRFIFSVIIISAFVLNVKAQTNRALFVAIDEYPAESGWADIHATNDSLIIIPMLLSKGYNRNNIHILANQKATKKAIVAELNRLATKSRTGDYVYIHFSCHGQQMIDDNGDEPDGLDEALIPYDAKRWFSKGEYEGENHLRDDEFGNLLIKIRSKIGAKGNLTVVLDACHSGTADRDGDDDDYVRGTAYVFAPDNATVPETDTNKLILNLKNDKKLAPITIFAACHPNQINYEYKEPASNTYYGSLSLAFGTLIQTNPAGITTSDFHKALEMYITKMFAGRKRKQVPYIESTDEEKAFNIGR